ncbi:PAS domain S-box-containing protein [Desulfobotulus alkaliphilus]|uniref:Oxygen sensor histidine kinase NreB n=1 Tax=Desulfobotulus alkaliphilus TaxID=622671 RepID=A0A562RZJ1_9BACT|nr:PAS domain-containing sensor histidine kinase [Desulfobotulus alkaliphilus]TWI74388.1 PAS domain S-box-containing protein [Desulfobotulus alkaliphilus]
MRFDLKSGLAGAARSLSCMGLRWKNYFRGGTDRDFEEDQAPLVRDRTSLLLVLAALLFPFFTVTDWAYYPDKIWALTPLRFGTGLICLMLFWVNRRIDLGFQSARLAFAGFYVCAFAMILIVVVTDGYRTSYYAGFLMVIVAFSSIMALPSRMMLPHIFIPYFVYFLVILRKSGSEQVSLFFLSHILVLVTLGICLMAAETNHRLRMKEYKARKTLEETKMKLQKQARELAERVAESRMRYRQLVERMNDCLGVSGPDGEIVYVNDRMCELLGLSREEMLGRHFSEFMDGLAKVRAEKEFEKRKAGQRSAYEACLQDHSGSSIPVIISAEALLDEKGLFQGSFAVITDISSQKRAERRIAQLTHELLRALENERHRIARDLHDHVAQDLSSLRIAFEDMAMQLESGSPIRRQTSHLSRRLQDAIKDLREIAYALRPPDLDTLGLSRTIYRYCQEFTDHTGIPVHFVTAGMEGSARDFDREINLYRLVQEALGNIRKHAGATRVDIRLIASHPDIILRIRDNGMGFDAERQEGSVSPERGMGLKGMAERVALLGGRFEIRSRPGEGCCISVWIPMEVEGGNGSALNAVPDLLDGQAG